MLAYQLVCHIHICVTQSFSLFVSRPDFRDHFYSIFWLGQGVTRVGSLVFFISMMAWYGSQSEATVYRSL